MPRPRATTPTYLRHSSSGQARIRYPGGATRNLGPYGSQESYREFDRLVAEWHASGGNSEPTPTLDPTVSQVISGWLEAAELDYAETSREISHFENVLKHLRQLYGEAQAKDFRAKQLESFRDYLVREIGWSPPTTARQVVRVRTVWRWAEKEGMVPAGSWEHLRTVRATPRQGVERREPTPPTFEQVLAAIKFLRRPVRAMVLVQWWAGMRPGEAMSMRPADLDRESIPGVWVYQPATHKNAWRPGRKDERIVLGPKAQAVIAQLIRWEEPDAPIFRPEDAIAEQLAARSANRTGPGRKKEKKVRRSHRRTIGGCYSSETYSRALARACQQATIFPFTAYDLRHAAKMRLDRVAGTEAARTVLRHKHINTTQLYGTRDVAAAVETMRQFG